jgi:N-acyl-D-aspartate/D-glutamate deacylase
MAADIVVLDRARFRDVATFTDPHHYTEGVVDLFVNGRAVILDGAMTGARPGRALRWMYGCWPTIRRTWPRPSGS